jgi:hypothetical protein
MNIPLRGNQVEKLPKGYHITRVQIGVGEKGIPIYYPNRRQRRTFLRRTNKNKITQIVNFIVPEEKYKEKPGDVIIAETTGLVNNKESIFYVIKRKLHHLKSAFK